MYNLTTVSCGRAVISYLFVGARMKSELAGGIGFDLFGIFSSEILRGRAPPDFTSLSSSSSRRPPAPSSSSVSFSSGWRIRSQKNQCK